MTTLVVSTVVMFLIALIAAASFAVIAQRRLPQLGMMAAVGATEKHLRLTMVATGAATGLVAGILGGVLGLGGWLALAPRMEQPLGFRIDAFHVPWWLILVGILLAVVTATGAAWWPGRTMSRIPPVVALSGRPPRPATLDRSAVLAAAFVVGGVVCLATGSNVSGGSATTLQVVLIVVGTLALIAGVLMFSPLAIRAVARGAARAPVAARLALRDLGRYQARSGAALAAIGLALGHPGGDLRVRGRGGEQPGSRQPRGDAAPDPRVGRGRPVRPRTGCDREPADRGRRARRRAATTRPSSASMWPSRRAPSPSPGSTGSRPSPSSARWTTGSPIWAWCT